MKKTLLSALLLSLTILLKTHAYTYGPYTYTVTNNQATITAFDNTYSGDLIIPAELNGYSIVAIGDSAFYECDYLTSVSIPSNITTIGANVFSECSSLAYIIVTSDNPNYTSQGGILFDKVLTTLIQYPPRLSNSYYTIPKSVTTIGQGAFTGCRLNSIVIPDNVITIEEAAFQWCNDLTYVSIGNCVTTIGANAFSECFSLNSITVDPDNPKYASQEGILFNKALTTLIQYPSSSPSPHYSIPNSVTTIADYAFAWCGYLTSINIGNSVTTIGSDVFKECFSLVSINVSLNNLCYSSHDGILYDNKLKTLMLCPRSFVGAHTIPDHITTIKDYAFDGCSSLTYISLPDSLEYIGNWAFCGCSSLTSITIPDGLKHIGDWAFYVCSSLTSVNIPDSVNYIGNRAFHDCSSLNEITVAPNNTSYGSHSGILFNKSLTSLLQCPGGFSGSYIIPDGVITIESNAFENCTFLTSITIPDSVTNINESSFEKCHRLTTAILGNGVTSINKNAFFWCSSLTNITIPNSVTTIGNNAFGLCHSLASVTIPNSVISIGNYVFYSCESLTSVSIPDSVTFIGSNAFAWCHSLTSIIVNPLNADYASLDGVLFNKERTTLIQCPNGFSGHYTVPDSVTVIGNSAFDECNYLTSIAIGSSVTTIGELAFFYCESLGTITLSSSVTYIGDSAFYGCYSLISAFCTGNAPDIGYDVFDETPATIYYLPSTSGWGDSFGGRPTTLWEPTIISVTLNANGGTVSPAMITVTNLLTYGSLPLPAKDNLIFDNWYTKHEGGTVVRDTTVIATTIGHTLYARWLPDSGNFEEYPYTYTVTNSQATITALDDSYSSALAIPEKLGGYPVVAIGYAAFIDCSSLTSIIIPKSIITIDDKAFYGCHTLTSVSFYGNAPYVGADVFYATPATIYYQPDTTGWGLTFGGRPTALWGTIVHDPKPDDNDSKLPERPTDDEPAVQPLTGTYNALLYSAVNFKKTMVKTPQGRVSIKLTKATGTITAKAILQSSSVSFKTKTWDQTNNDTFQATMTTSKGETLTLNLNGNQLWGTLKGGKAGAEGFEFDGSRNHFITKGDSAAAALLEKYRGYYTLSLPMFDTQSYDDTVDAAPHGVGYLTLKIANKGSVKIAGLLADGTKVSSSATILPFDLSGNEASVTLFAPLYSKKGAISGLLWLDANTRTITTDSANNWFILWNNPGKRGIDGFAQLLEACGGFYGNRMALETEYIFSSDVTGTAWFSGPDNAYSWEHEPQDVVVRNIGSKLTVAKSKNPKRDKTSGHYIYDLPDNPCNVALSFAIRTGIFKGKYRLYCDYTNDKGKLIHKTISVPYFGIMTPVRNEEFLPLPTGMGYSLVPESNPSFKSLRLKRSCPVQLY